MSSIFSLYCSAPHILNCERYIIAYSRYCRLIFLSFLVWCSRLKIRNNCLKRPRISRDKGSLMPEPTKRGSRRARLTPLGSITILINDFPSPLIFYHSSAIRLHSTLMTWPESVLLLFMFSNAPGTVRISNLVRNRKLRITVENRRLVSCIFRRIICFILLLFYLLSYKTKR